MILFTLFGLLTPIAVEFNFLRRQQAALALLKFWVNDHTLGYEPVQPTWFWNRIEKWTGVDCRHLKGAIFFAYTPFTREQEDAFLQLKHLKQIFADREGELPRRVMEGLADFPDLEFVSLGFPRLTREKLEPLSRCRRLKEVRLYDYYFPSATSEIHNKAMIPLAELPSLETLWIQATVVTPDGLIPILDRQKLTTLFLPRRDIRYGFRQQDHRPLLRCSSLADVVIFEPSPVDIRVLGQLPNLKRLYVAALHTQAMEEAILALPNLQAIHPNIGGVPTAEIAAKYSSIAVSLAIWRQQGLSSPTNMTPGYYLKFYRDWETP